MPNEEGYATADTGSDQPSVPASDSAGLVCKCFLHCYGMGLRIEPNCAAGWLSWLSVLTSGIRSVV